MEITKMEPRLYTYRLVPDKKDPEYASCTWARFGFDCDNGRLDIHGDAGDYSYGWGFNEHENFMHLMSRIDKHYLLSKISDRSVFLLEESIQANIKEIELNGWECYGIKSEEEWESIKQEILDIDEQTEIEFYYALDAILPYMESESFMVEKDYPYGAKVIANLFTKYLQPKIKEDFGF